MMSAQTNRQVQAYFAYDSKKSGGYTVSHLRIGEAPIRAPYLIGQADFLACHQPTLMNLDVVAQSVKPGGTVLLNLPDGMEIPAKLRRSIATRHALLYTIDADAIAAQCGLGGRINTVMQTAFFQLNAFFRKAAAAAADRIGSGGICEEGRAGRRGEFECNCEDGECTATSGRAAGMGGTA